MYGFIDEFSRKKIYDTNDNELLESEIDFDAGRLLIENKIIARHPAIEGVSHCEILQEYPNGGKDVKVIWDVTPIEEWDEYEQILRYTPYTEAELKQKKLEKNNIEFSGSDLAEYLADYEYRLCLLELGVNADDL